MLTLKSPRNILTYMKNTICTWSIEGKIKYTTTKGGHKDTYSTKHQNKKIKSNQIKLNLVSSKKKTRDKKQKFKYLIMSYVNPKVVMYVKTPHENQTYPIPLDVSDYFF